MVDPDVERAVAALGQAGDDPPVGSGGRATLLGNGLDERRFRGGWEPAVHPVRARVPVRTEAPDDDDNETGEDQSGPATPPREPSDPERNGHGAPAPQGRRPRIRLNSIGLDHAAITAGGVAGEMESRNPLVRGGLPIS